jgi:LuxR family maltose regulon positive regulatory protein
MRNVTYLSEDLKQKLGTYKHYPFTIVNAPDGYGKTSVLKEFFRRANSDVYWVKCEYGQGMFFEVFTEVMLRASCNKLPLGFDIPHGISDSYKVVDWARQLEFPRNTVIILDDYMGTQETYVEYVFKILSGYEDNPFKLVFVYNQNLPSEVKKSIKRDSVLFIDRDDLKLRVQDIMELSSRNGYRLTEQQAWGIYDYCGGWPIIVGMQLRQYERSGNFDVHGQVSAFLHDEVWMRMDNEDREFLTLISAFDPIVFVQTRFWMEYDNASGSFMEKLERCPFVVYDGENRQYRLDGLVKSFFMNVFEQLPMSRRRHIYSVAANVYIEAGALFDAIKCCDMIGDYDTINGLDTDFEKLFGHVNKKNKPIFIHIAHYYLNNEVHSNYKLQIIMVLVMYLLNETDIYRDLSEKVWKNAAGDSALSEDERQVYLSELSYVRGLITPDATDGINEFGRVADSMKGHLSFVVGRAPILFGVPSAMMIYHRKQDGLDEEMSLYEGYALDHSRMTNGHGKGIEELFRAEIYYNRGDIDNACVACHEAMRVSRSRDQNSIYIAAMLVLARIAICEGNVSAFVEWMEAISNDLKARDGKILIYAQTIELCMGFLNVLIGDDDRLPEWLKDDNNMEEETNYVVHAFCNVVLGKHLINTGQYQHIRGVCGHMLGIARSYSFILPVIYTYIYMAIAEMKTGDAKHAGAYLVNALENACDDRLYMPFVESYEELVPIIKLAVIPPRLQGFMKNVERLSKSYITGRNRILRERRSKDNHGLTAREGEVARLAAQRMSNKEIAEVLMIAESTVKSNMKTIFAKLEIKSRSQLYEIFK